MAASGKFARRKRRKRGYAEDGTVQPASTSRRSLRWGWRSRRVKCREGDIVREMGVYHGVNFGAKMCSGKNVICLFRCCFCGVDIRRNEHAVKRDGERRERREKRERTEGYSRRLLTGFI